MQYGGMVSFRIVSRTMSPDGSRRMSYGLTIPKDVVVRLGWHRGDTLEVWFEPEKDLVVAQRRRVSRPRLGREGG